MQASRMLVEERGLPSDSTCTLEAEPGKLEIKRREPGIYNSIYQFTSWSTLQISNYDEIIDFHVDSMSLKMSFKKCSVMLNKSSLASLCIRSG